MFTCGLYGLAGISARIPAKLSYFGLYFKPKSGYKVMVIFL